MPSSDTRRAFRLCYRRARAEVRAKVAGGQCQPDAINAWAAIRAAHRLEARKLAHTDREEAAYFLWLARWARTSSQRRADVVRHYVRQAALRRRYFDPLPGSPLTGLDAFLALPEVQS